ncbi:MAG TPA: hypothetical protein VII99_13520 [Bacteroidia bacterium]
MKKLFLALALTGFVGAVTVNTASAISHSKVIMKGGDDDKAKKDKKSKDKCCKSDGKSADGKCSSSNGEKKCCHSKEAKTEQKETK